MKCSFTPLILVVSLLILPNFLFGNSPGKDFLITLNGSKLTGIIKEISFSNSKSKIFFENDFGDTYTVLPATIFGFVFEEKGEASLYESKYLKGEWRFLKVQKMGEALTLYKSSERQLQFTQSNESPIVVEEKNPQIWLQFKGEQPFKVYRFTYKSILRRRMKSYPDLAEKIGKRGFQFKNLSMIVELYNMLSSKNEG